MTENALKELDLKGLKCPLPVLRTRRFLRDHMQIGDRVAVHCTDQMSVIDIPHFCNEFGHIFINAQTTDFGHILTVEKGHGAQDAKS